MATTIAHEHGVCTVSFDNLCRALETTDASYGSQISLASLLDEYGRFNVWAGNIGAHQTGRSSLDHRLRDAGHIRDQVIKLLRYLRENLDDATSIVNGSRLPYEDISLGSESDSSDGAETSCTSLAKSEPIQHQDSLGTELEQLQHGITKIVANLYKLSTIIRKGNVSHDRLLKSSKINVSYYEPYDLQHAKNRFPLASAELTDRMGRSISRRRQYLKYREKHHEKLSVLPSTFGLTEDFPRRHDEMPKMDAVALSRAPTVQQSIAQGRGGRKPTSVIQSTNASTLIPSKLPEPVDLDVDVYSDADTQTSHATSVTGEEKLRVPPPPESSRDGRDFECPYCYTICRLNGSEEWQRRREWKRHVYKDLQPYICTFDSCFKAETMFEKRRDWFSHELQVHRREWCCNVDNHEAYQEKEVFTEHMQQMHADLSYDFQSSRIISLFERPLTTTTGSCPFCVGEGTKNLPVGRLEKHLARHMEILALFALPRNHDKDGRTSADSALRADSSPGTVSDSLCSHPDVLQGASAEIGSQVSDDIDVSDLHQPGVLINIIQDFCEIERSRNTLVPKDCFVGVNMDTALEDRIQNDVFQIALMRRFLVCIYHQPDGDLKLADLMTLLHSELNAESYIYGHHPTEDQHIASLMGALGYCMSSFASSENTFNDKINQTGRLLQNLMSTHELEQDRTTDDLTWDYIQPKVPIATSCLTLLSRALAASPRMRSLGITPSDTERGQYMALRMDLESLSQALTGVDFDRKDAKEVERKIWSQEDQITKYCLLATSHAEEGREDGGVRKRMVGHISAMAREILLMLGIAPIQPKEFEGKTSEPANTNGAVIKTVASWIRGSTPDQDMSHRSALSAWQSGSHEWFLDSWAYKNWERGENLQLWVLGNPGCGKTVLSSSIIEQLQDVKENVQAVGLAWVYCQSWDDSPPRSRDVLRSLIAQLSLQSHLTPQSLGAALTECISSDSLPSDKKLVVVLVELLSLFQVSYIVIDSFDQCSNRDSLLKWLKNIRSAEPRLRMLMTCRPATFLRYSSGLDALDNFGFLIPSNPTSMDIAAFLRERLRNHDLYDFPVELEDEIISTLGDQAHGIFEWPILQLQRISGYNDAGEIRQTLSSPPKKISETWNKCLIQASEEKDEAAHFLRHLLEILAVSARALSIEEVQDIYKYHMRTDPHFNSTLDPMELSSVFDCLSPLLAFSEAPANEKYQDATDDWNVSLVHPWLKSFLFSEARSGHGKMFGISEVQSNCHMAESCLVYLLQFFKPIDRNDEGVFIKYPFLQYAAHYWYVHALKADGQALQNLALSFFTSDVCFATWLSIYDPDEEQNGRWKAEHPSPLYYAAFLGFQGLTKSLLAKGARLNEAGGKHHYPLLAAIESGHEEVVRVLIDEGDDINRRFKNGDTALIRAAIRREAGIVRLLLSEGVLLDAKDKRHLTALHWAVRQGCEEIVLLLLEAGADINARDVDGRTALHFALHGEEPQTEVFNLLLDRGIDIIQPDKFGDTILHHATWHSYLHGMQMLRGA